MSKFKIVTYNTLVGKTTEIEKAVLSDGGYDDFMLVRVEGNDDEAFLKESEDADAICAWTYMDKAVFKRLKNLKIVVAPAIGVDPFDIGAATECGVCIANIPDYCLEEVAVHTVSLILDCARKLTFLDRSVKSGQWNDRACGKMYRMAGRTYGLMSFGRISQRVSELLKPFGLNMIAYDPFATDEIFDRLGVERAESIDELFRKSDYISVHTPHTPATHHMVGSKQFKLMKEESIIVLTGRGGVVDEIALKEALDCGKVACAGVDVLEDEKAYQSVLTPLNNVVITPHCAYYSESSSVDLRRKAMEQIVSVVRNKEAPRNLVNKDVLRHARFQMN